ncbi:hypothetical protein [Amycolatopsis circi]|uniref:hypothetical protein n=1 Tax=Amycolatopsis circi TaxID=871959 RepID=UPI0013BE95ED|nr:hypothetical protein [Amycolatopsis circi]
MTLVGYYAADRVDDYKNRVSLVADRTDPPRLAVALASPGGYDSAVLDSGYGFKDPQVVLEHHFRCTESWPKGHRRHRPDRQGWEEARGTWHTATRRAMAMITEAA